MAPIAIGIGIGIGGRALLGRVAAGLAGAGVATMAKKKYQPKRNPNQPKDAFEHTQSHRKNASNRTRNKHENSANARRAKRR